MSRSYTFDRTVRIVFTFIGIGSLLFLLWILRYALLPFFIALLLAYMINPLVEFFQYKLRLKNRFVSVLLALFLLFGIIVVGCMILIPIIQEQIVKFYEVVTIFENNKNISSWVVNISNVFHISLSMKDLLEFISFDDLKNLVQEFTPKLWNFMGSTINVLFEVVTWLITLIYLIFILIDFENVSQKWLKIFPPKVQPIAEMLAKDVLFEMNNYFRGQAVVALCVGVLFSIGFTLIGLPMSILLGIFTGLLNLVPYLQTIGIIPLILLCFLKSLEGEMGFFSSFGLGLLVLGIVQVIQDTFLVPKIMGKATGLNPIAILLSLSIWGTLFGIGGMIVALPLTTLIYSYYQRFVLKNEPFAINIEENEKKTSN